MTPRWISKHVLMLLHDESLVDHGGSSGLRDEGLLESALQRPVNLDAYAGDDARPDLPDLAAAYAFGIAKNHPFVDGNKRSAFLAVGLFLGLNGLQLTASQADATLAVFGLAAGEVSEAEFAAWVRARSAARSPKVG